MPPHTKTRFQAVYAAHTQGCALNRGAKTCDCRPSFYGVAWSRGEGKKVKTRRFRTATEARDARNRLVKGLEAGERPDHSELRLNEATTRFLDAADKGVALNKNGRRYKKTAVDDLRSALTLYVLPTLGRRRMSDVSKGQVQTLVDELQEGGMSGSRIRTVVNAVRSLYRWANRRDLCQNDPARLVDLPAMDAKPRDRVASPGEMRRLLDCLPLEDAVPYGLAVYATARRQEVQALRWRDIDLEAGTLELGVDEQARKYEASRRTVPILVPLRAMLRRHFLAEGRPSRDGRVCPGRVDRGSGRLAAGPLARRCTLRWDAAGLQRIGLHECRHTAASWMDGAAVPLATRSALMGHSLRLPGAAQVTARYSHQLDGDLERARVLLDGFISEREQQEAESG